MQMRKGFCFLLSVSFLLLSSMTLSSLANAGEHSVPLKRAKVDLHDKKGLQSGAKFYMNYCSGCHSLGYMRYQHIAKDLGIVDATGKVNNQVFKENLIFTGAKIGDLIKVAIPKEDAGKWFGIVPPDLTLEARVRGADWLKTFLTGFYVDKNRPWGANNYAFPDVAMPNVLENLQGEQVPVFRTETVPYDGKTKTIKVIDHLQLVHDGKMTEQQFDNATDDLVSFLVYVAEPMKLTRYKIGVFVLGFLFLFFWVTYLLKKEYWRDVK